MGPVVRRWRGALQSAALRLASGETSLAAAGCAFFATLALFPALSTLISLYGLLFDPRSIEPQLHYLQRFMPPGAFELFTARITALVSAGNKATLGVGLAVSVLVALYSAAAGTRALLRALNLAHGLTETRGFLRFELVSTVLTLVLILGAGLAVTVLVVLPLVFSLLGAGRALAVLALGTGFVVMLAFMAAALVLLYRFGPAFTEAPRARQVAAGALLAVTLWGVLAYLFALYVGRFAAYAGTYGPLATVVGLMMWFYLSAYTVLFGALVNAALDRGAGHSRARPDAQSGAPPPI